ETMSYERASADVLSGPGSLDVLSRESPSVTGRLPPATRIDTHAARGNLLSRGIDVWGGVRLQTPTGLEGMTDRGHLDSLSMHASGTSPVELHAPHSNRLRAPGVRLPPPAGVEGRPARAPLDSLPMHASGTSPVELHGPNGYWLRAQGFDL